MKKVVTHSILLTMVLILGLAAACNPAVAMDAIQTAGTTSPVEQ